MNQSSSLLLLVTLLISAVGQSPRVSAASGQPLLTCAGVVDGLEAHEIRLRLRLSGDPDALVSTVSAEGSMTHFFGAGSTYAEDEVKIGGTVTPRAWYGGSVDLGGVERSREERNYVRILIYRETARAEVWIDDALSPLRLKCRGDLVE